MDERPFNYQDRLSVPLRSAGIAAPAGGADSAGPRSERAGPLGKHKEMLRKLRCYFRKTVM